MKNINLEIVQTVVKTKTGLDKYMIWYDRNGQ